MNIISIQIGDVGVVGGRYLVTSSLLPQHWCVTNSGVGHFLVTVERKCRTPECLAFFSLFQR